MDGFDRARRTAAAMLTLALLLFAGNAGWAADADDVGRVLVVAGGVQARDVRGGLRELAPGDRVRVGDTVVTDDAGRTQIRFVDGGLVSLRPASEYRLEEFSITP